jgi:hypothetical protein
VLVVEPNYHPDSRPCVFQPCLYPMKTLHPRSMYTLPRGGVQRGVPPLRGPGGLSPSWGFGGKAPKGKNFLANVYCNFIINLDHSL